MAGRRRNETIDNTIASVALDLVKEMGYGRFTVEGLCERMGIAKTTVYKRWPSRQKLLDAVLAERLQIPVTKSDQTLGIRQRLLLLVLQEIEFVGATEGRAVALSLLEAMDAGEPTESLLLAAAIDAHKRTMRDLIQEARHSGELVGSLDVEIVVDMLFGAIWGSLITGRVISPSRAEYLVDCALNLGHG